jgi:hypothetical protein
MLLILFAPVKQSSPPACSFGVALKSSVRSGGVRLGQQAAPETDKAMPKLEGSQSAAGTILREGRSGLPEVTLRFGNLTSPRGTFL